MEAPPTPAETPAGTAAQTQATAHDPWPARSMGATLGALLGAAAMGLLFLLSGIPAVEDALHVRAIVAPLGSPDGFVSKFGGGLAAWAVAPVAAALAGLLCAGRTMAGQRWAGVSMGYLTYGIALLLAPVVVFGPTWSGLDPAANLYDPHTTADQIFTAVANALIGIPFIAAIAGVVLAPILVVCSIAGIIWAAALRAVRQANGEAVSVPDRPAANGLVLVMIAMALGLGWLIVAGLIGGSDLLGGPGFVD